MGKAEAGMVFRVSLGELFFSTATPFMLVAVVAGIMGTVGTGSLAVVWIPLVVLAIWSIIAIPAWIAFYVKVAPEGISGFTYAGKQKSLTWEEMRSAFEIEPWPAMHYICLTTSGVGPEATLRLKEWMFVPRFLSNWSEFQNAVLQWAPEDHPLRRLFQVSDEGGSATAVGARLKPPPKGRSGAAVLDFPEGPESSDPLR